MKQFSINDLILYKDIGHIVLLLFLAEMTEFDLLILSLLEWW